MSSVKGRGSEPSANLPICGSRSPIQRVDQPEPIATPRSPRLRRLSASAGGRPCCWPDAAPVLSAQTARVEDDCGPPAGRTNGCFCIATCRVILQPHPRCSDRDQEAVCFPLADATIARARTTYLSRVLGRYWQYPARLREFTVTDRNHRMRNCRKCLRRCVRGTTQDPPRY